MRDRHAPVSVVGGMNIKAPLITTIALALVAGAPAATAHVNHALPTPGDPAHAVPAGKIDHSVTVTQVSGSSEWGIGSQRYWPREVTSGMMFGAAFQSGISMR